MGPQPKAMSDGPGVLRRTRPVALKANSDAIPTKDEEDELRQIASALTVVAATSAAMPEAQLATLKKVSNNPSIFFARELPAPVE
jgi:hypothetical protein